MPRTLRLPPELEEEISRLAELHDRSENAEIIVALKQYVERHKKCSMCEHLAEVECKIGNCAPSTWWCAEHYAEIHIPDEE